MQDVTAIPWSTVLRLQELVASSSTVNHTSNAREETLDALIDDIASGRPFPDTEAVERRCATLVANRANKYRNRSKIIKRYAHITDTPTSSNYDELLDREFLERVQTELSPQELRAVRGLSDGFTYQELAQQMKTTPGSLKTRVSRLRKRMHRPEHLESLAG